MPAAELIKHDIYIQEMLDKHRDLLEASFGAGLVDLRNRLKRVEQMGTLTADS